MTMTSMEIQVCSSNQTRTSNSKSLEHESAMRKTTKLLHVEFRLAAPWLRPYLLMDAFHSAVTEAKCEASTIEVITLDWQAIFCNLETGYSLGHSSRQEAAWKLILKVLHR